MRRSCRSAFTLIELMVVVAIIVVLIAMLVPSLGKAKEQARRAACAANLRSLGVGFRAYGSEFQDSCPIGIQGSGFVCDIYGNRDTRDGSFCMYAQNNSNGLVCGWLGLGMPNAIGAFTGNGPYFCPTALINIPERKPLTSGNMIWPAQLLNSSGARQFGKGDAQGNLYDVATGTVNTNVTALNCDALATYSVRGAIPKDQPTSSANAYWLVIQLDSFYPVNDPRHWDTSMKVPPGFAHDPAYPGHAQHQGVPMPKFANLRTNMAIAGDFVCGSAYVDVVHKDGVNVLRVDGSAGWVNRSAFDKYLSAKPLDWKGGISVQWQSPDYLGNGQNEPNTSANYSTVWNRIDAQ